MTGEFDLEAAIVAFCATETVDRDRTINPRLTVNRQTDDLELTILVDEGIGGIKKRHVSLAKLAEAYAASPEYPPDDEYPPSTIVVLVPAEETDPEPFEDPLPELEPDPDEATDLDNVPLEDPELEPEPESEQVAVAGFSDIPGVSPALESRMHDAGILTYGDLKAAVDSGAILQLPGVGAATVEKIRTHIWPKNDAQ